MREKSGTMTRNSVTWNRSRQEIRKEMGVLFQGAALFDSLTVEENVLFPLDMLTSQSKAEKLDRANFCLERVRVTGPMDYTLPN